MAPLHTLNKTERKTRRPVLLVRCEDTSKLQIEYLINEIRCDSSPTPLQKSILLASSSHFLRLLGCWRALSSAPSTRPPPWSFAPGNLSLSLCCCPINIWGENGNFFFEEIKWKFLILALLISTRAHRNYSKLSSCS